MKISSIGSKIGAAWREITILFSLFFIVVGFGLLALGLNREEAHPIRIATARLPPQMDEFGEGKEADIIRAALGKVFAGRAIEFYVMPFTRHWDAFVNDDRFDGVTTVPLSLDLNRFPTDPYIKYENGIVYRKSDFPDGLGPDPMMALAGKRVVAFAGATGILPDLRSNVSRLQLYIERDDQYAQSVMLVRKFVDAVIADRLIIDAYDRKVMAENYTAASTKLEFAPVFCPTSYRMVFRTNELREAFDLGLDILRKSGELEKIDARYRQRSGLSEVEREPTRSCN